MKNKFVLNQDKPKPEAEVLPHVERVPVHIHCAKCGSTAEFIVRMTIKGVRCDAYFCTSPSCDHQTNVPVA